MMTRPTAQEKMVKTAVVTGGGRGIGATIAAHFARDGFHAAILDIDDASEATAAAIRKEGGSATYHLCDVTKLGDVQQVVKRCTEEGHVVVVVNNAGWTSHERFLEQESAVWDRLIAVNFTAVLNVCYAFLPVMAPGGAIVNIASDAARVGVSGEAVYAGAKSGVIGFSKSLAVECGRSGIRVNVVSPGSTKTELLAAILTEEDIAKRVRGIPMRRLGDPDDVARAVHFLATGATHVTGQVLSVNGGAARVG
jgi:2-hydroxycyclohexanecarboxyl-CoA dehydrogenase